MKLKKNNFFERFKKRLIKTRENFSYNLFKLFTNKKIDDDLFNKLEEFLLVSDVGFFTTRKIINKLIKHSNSKELKNIDLLYSKLRIDLLNILISVDKPLVIKNEKPYVILMVGVNGSGKTTTIAKLAHRYNLDGKKIMLAAGDTFRVSAIEQLQIFGNINKIPVIAQHYGADPSSVIFEAIKQSRSKDIDVLIIDTAGRLQNKFFLMEELKKIVRVIKKFDKHIPHETMLTLDSNIGQNSINQAKFFNDAIGLTGITLTKFDSTAKGGVIFSIAEQINIPIRYIGVGENIEDLCIFNANEFIDALFI
ncbi:signal recognition particle-docking protein FtsY [Candidatus Providencia siddallii]|uniref:Signal recognition particle receptor FtsY n=1 Tax=Candidatus Providencia siddallii TaxID=1715285 RepID=A0ABM9NPK6_9GAMM